MPCSAPLAAAAGLPPTITSLHPGRTQSSWSDSLPVIAKIVRSLLDSRKDDKWRR